MQTPAPGAIGAFSRLSPNAQGALWMLASVIGASAMTVSIRVLTPDIHSSMLAFLRSAFGLLVVLPFLWRARRGGTARLAFSAWPLHLARGLCITVALNAGFYAIWQLPMATATILFFMAPVFATIFAQLMLGEVVRARRWSAIGAGFLGALIILRPGLAEVNLGMLAALGSSVAFAAALILGKVIAGRDSADSVFVSSSVLVAFGALPPALFFWQIPDAFWLWSVVGVLVASSSLRTYADIRAYAAGEASFIAPFSYLRLLIIGVIGYVWFAEAVDLATMLGGAVIVAATLYISLREAQVARRRRPGHAP